MQWMGERFVGSQAEELQENCRTHKGKVALFLAVSDKIQIF